MKEELNGKAEKDGEKKLIRETVFGGKLRGKEALKRVLLVAGCAVLFGIIASLTFVLFKPVWESASSEETTGEPITLYPDESTQATVETIAPPEETAETSAPSDVWGIISPSVHDIVDEKLQEFAVSDSVSAAKKATVQTVNKSLVTITRTAQGRDWFDREFTDKSTTFGLTVSQTTSEVIFITPSSAVTGDGEISVTLGEKQIPATVKATDSIYGMSAVSIPSSELPDGVEIVPIPFGNSSVISQGSSLIIMGSPQGSAGSILYGMVSYTDMNYQDVDASLRIFRTDIPSVPGTKGFAVNLSGEMVGWVTPFSGDEANISVAAVSDLKVSIERLCNGSSLPMLGIKGQSVPAAQIAEGIPEGIYVNSVVDDSPAAEAGIMSGDVIVSMAGEPVPGFAQLIKIFSGKAPGDVTTVTVSRAYRGTYSEIELNATLSDR